MAVFRVDNELCLQWSSHDFVPQVGDVQIQYWTHPGTVTGARSKAKAAEIEPSLEDCFIQIPSIHPGAAKYDKHPIEQRRVIDITAWQIVLSMDVTLEVLAKGWQGSREDLCKYILSRFKSRWERSGRDKLMQQAKADLQSYNSQKTTQSSKDANRAFRPQLDGKQVPVNASGIATLYWTKPDGKSVRVTLSGGRSSNMRVAKDVKGDDAIRSVHFLDTGVDIRDRLGTSLGSSHAAGKRLSNSTFPGYVLAQKLDQKGMESFVELWEAEIGWDFHQAFPSAATEPGKTKSHVKVLAEGPSKMKKPEGGSAFATGKLVRAKLGLSPPKPITKPTDAALKLGGFDKPTESSAPKPTSSGPKAATPKRKAATSLQHSDPTNVEGKCKQCRLTGVACTTDRPCERCRKKGIKCED